MANERGPNRRELMRKLGASTVIGGIGFTHLTNTAAARIAADPNGSIEDPDWGTFEDYTNSQYENTSTSSASPEAIAGPGEFRIPNPVSLGFDVCATEPDGGELCVSTFTLGEEMYEECAGRTLAKFGFEAIQKRLAYDGTYEFEWGLKCWVAFDEYDCIWAGVGSGLNECSRIVCPGYPDYYPTIADVKNKVWDISSDIVAEYRRKTGYPTAGSQAETALIALVAVVVFLAIFAPPPGVPG